MQPEIDRTPRLKAAGWTRVLLAVAVPGLAAPVAAQVPGEPQTPPGAGIVIDTVIVEGTMHLEPHVVAGTFALPIGTPITYREIQEAERRLWGTGRFRDIQVFVREDDARVAIVLRVEERPLVRRLVIQGLENLRERDVRDSLAFRTGEPHSPDRVVRASRYIQEELAQKGIPFASVEARLVPVEDREGEIDLILEVVEGHRVTISEVVFRGNEAFSDSELRSVIGTRREGFWWFRTGQFEEAALEEDLLVRLPEFYASNGYLDLQLHSDTLVIDPRTGKARLEIALVEGPRYRVADFSVVGSRRFPASQLEQIYQSEEGGLLRAFGIGRARVEGLPVFDRTAFLDATRRVGDLYRNQGYLYVLVDPVIDRQPAAEGESDPTVSLRWEIEEGQPAYIRRVNIAGNSFTHDRVIRERIALLPGQVYSEQDILRSYQAIQGLGFFETPMAIPDIHSDEATGDVDITFVVEERQTGSVSFGTAMGGATGVSGFLGYEQPNLFGQAKSGSLRWDFGRYQNSFTVSYTDPSLFQSRVSGSISLFDSRDRFFSFATGERKRRGFLTRFGVPLRGAINTRVFTGYSLSRTEYRLREGVDDASLFGIPPGTQSQLSLGIRRTTIDHPIFPTVGSEMSWTTEINGGLLGGDGSFTKHTAEGTWWVPVGQVGGGGAGGGRPIIFALGLRTRIGTVVGDASNFPFDRFWLGGVQFGETLRGYEETTITPRGYFPRGSGQVTDIQRLGNAFMTLGAEYALRLSDNISLSAFYEAGNVWRNVREVDPSRLFRGAGLGLQLVTPFGPMGLDYAYGFDRPVPGWELHFRMGGMGPF